jgi:nitrate/nitrite transporter NarK
MLSGLALCTGVLGAVSAGVPLRLLVDAFGWRGVLVVSGALTAALAVAIWLFVRDDPSERGYASHSSAAAGAHAGLSAAGGIRRALESRNVWLVFLISGGVSGPPLTFAGLWGVPFLVTHYGLTTAAAASLTSLLLASWALAGPFLGALSDRLRRRKPLYAAGTALAAAGWAVVFLVPGLPLPLLGALLVAIGIASSCAMVGFAIAKESAPAPLAGTATGVANMGNMLGGMVMPPLVGWVLDRGWNGAMAGGARVYEFSDYRAGFSPMLAWLLLALVLVAFTRETHCRQAQ